MTENLGVENLFSIKGKTALVTGGSSGLGLMMAKGLLQNEAKVVIASRNQQKIDRAARELETYGKVFAFTCDVTDAIQRKNLLSFVSSSLGSLDILINNAGSNWGAPLEDYPDEGFEKVISTNLNAVFSLTRDAVSVLKMRGDEKDPARIINIGSMDGIHIPIVQRVPTFAYSASKAALHHLTKAMAVELASRKVTVNAIAPGFFESKMTDYVLKHYRSDIENDCPLGRIGQEPEMVGILLYLVSRAGSYTNGAVIPIDGGTSISKGRREWMT